MRFRFIALLLLSALAVLAQVAEPAAPVFVSLFNANDPKHVELRWTHPDAYDFDVRYVADGKPGTNRLHHAGNKVNNLHAFFWKTKLHGTTNVYSIRAVSEAGIASPWSNIISKIL